MKSFHSLSSLSSMGIAALSLSIAACAPPERGNNDYMPWGGIELDGADDEGEEEDTENADDDGDPSADGDGDSGGDDGADGADAGDGPSDGGDDGEPPPPDDSGGEPPPPDEPPPSPYTGGWDIGTCQGDISPTGTGVGQVVPDFLLIDQYGDAVRLHDFCHKAVYIVAGAFW